jgi:hypothetical protein
MRVLVSVFGNGRTEVLALRSLFDARETSSHIFLYPSDPLPGVISPETPTDQKPFKFLNLRNRYSRVGIQPLPDLISSWFVKDPYPFLTLSPLSKLLWFKNARIAILTSCQQPLPDLISHALLNRHFGDRARQSASFCGPQQVSPGLQPLL